jgi:hypothetical protein
MLGKVLLQIHNIHHYQVKFNQLYHRIRLFELRIRSVFMGSEFPFDADQDFKYFFLKQRRICNLFYIKNMPGTKLFNLSLNIFIRITEYILNNFVVPDSVVDWKRQNCTGTCETGTKALVKSHNMYFFVSFLL